MTPNTKPCYIWCNEAATELPPGVMPTHRKGSVCMCWNDFTEKWEFGESNGRYWNFIRNMDAVPGGFRAYLLIMGPSP